MTGTTASAGANGTSRLGVVVPGVWASSELRDSAEPDYGLPADQRVLTDKGLIRIGDLVSGAREGEDCGVFGRVDPQSPGLATIATRCTVNGWSDVLQLRFSDGAVLHCTGGQPLWTENRGWVPAASLVSEDRVVKSIHYAAREISGAGLPGTARAVSQATKKLALPEIWDEELAHYLGWIVGDGCLTAAAAVTVYGNHDDKSAALPRHRALLRKWTGFDAKPSLQSNGTVQLRSCKLQVRLFLRALGVAEVKSASKRVPSAIFEAPEDAVIQFLQGLFDADGCVVNNAKKGSRYVGLGSKSQDLLREVQELLASLGMASRIYETGSKRAAFRYRRRDGTEVTYGSPGKSYDLRITGRSLAEFAAHVHFSVPSKKDRLTNLVDNHGYYSKSETIRLVARELTAPAETYRVSGPRDHGYVVTGLIVAG